MAVIKPISLAEENGSYEIWKKLFYNKESNFSGWIQEKLIEEEKNNHNEEYLLAKIAKLNLQKEHISDEIVMLNKQLDDIQKVSVIKEEEISDEEYTSQLNKAIWRLKIYKNESDEILMPIAIEYLKIPEDVRPNAKEFIEQYERL